MNENAKKASLLAIIIVACYACFLGAKRVFGGDEMILENRIQVPAGHKSEKELALERQRATGKGDPAPYKEKVVEERDLGG